MAEVRVAQLLQPPDRKWKWNIALTDEQAAAIHYALVFAKGQEMLIDDAEPFIDALEPAIERVPG